MSVAIVSNEMTTATAPFVGLSTRVLSRSLRFDEAEVALNLQPDEGALKTRPGLKGISTAPNGGAIEGIHDYVLSDGSNLLLVKAGAQLYKVDRAADPITWTAIGDGGLTSGQIAQFVTANNKVYIAHGGTPKATDGTGLFNWLIDPPSPAPTVASNSAVGNLDPDGTYSYKVTYYSSSWGLESPSSAETTALDLENQSSSIQLSSLSETDDERVDKVRIYRRRIDAAEGDWLLVDEIAEDGVSTYLDKKDDGMRSLDFIAPESFDSDLPEFDFISWNNDVMLATTSAEPNNLYFTESGGVTPYGFFTADNEVSSIHAYQAAWAILTRSSIWLLTGGSVRDFSFRKTIENRGCISPYGGVSRDEGVYMASDLGIYLYPLQRPVKLSGRVQTDWKNRNTSLDHKIKAIDIPELGAIGWLYASTPTSSSVDKLLVYFYDNSAKVSDHSWFEWKITGLTCGDSIRDSGDDEEITLLGFSDGRLAQLGGEDDGGTAIDWEWRTGKHDRNHPARNKHWGDCSVDCVKKTGGSVFNIHARFDEDESDYLVGTHDSSGYSHFAGRVSAQSQQIRLRFEGSGPVEIFSYAVQAILSDRPS